MTTKFISIFILALICITYASDKEIKTLSVLLPISYTSLQNKIQYLMQAYGACYLWSTNQPKVITLLTITEDRCDSKAIIILNHEGPFQAPLIVSAIDRETQQTVKANVRLSKLAKIQIVTKFKIMNVGQLQEFYVVGYDQESNTFSSLQGFRFEWTITQDSSIVEKISIKQSAVHQQTNYRKDLQKLNYQTDMLVIKALKIGQVSLSVKVKQYNYNHIQSSIKISIQQRFEIVPASPVYLITQSKYKFILVNSRFEKINLPNPIYSQSIGANFQISNTLQVTSPGFQTKTNLAVRDVRTNPPYISEVEIFSYHPDQIALMTKQYIIVGRQQNYAVEFFYKRLQLSGTVDIQASGDFKIDKNKLTILTNKKTIGNLRVKYKNLAAERRIIANLPLKAVLTNNQLILPVGQGYQLNIIGGSQSYLFQSDKKTIQIINITPLGYVKALSIGKTTITVIDKKDPNNKITINVFIEEIKAIKSLQQRKQAILNQQSEILIAAIPQNHKGFTTCNQISFLLETNPQIFTISGVQTNINNIISKISNEASTNYQWKTVLEKQQKLTFNPSNALRQYQKYIETGDITQQNLFISLKQQANYGICRGIQIRGNKPKHQSVKIKIDQKNSKVFNQDFSLRIYQQIKSTLEPKYKNILMTPLSRGSFQISGGPIKWEQSLIYQLNNREVAYQDLYFTCRSQIEKIDYSLKVSNKRTLKLPRPVYQILKTTVNCKYPVEIAFQMGNNTIFSNQLFVKQNTFIHGQILAFDDSGVEFYNSSNLEYEWAFTGIRKTSGDREPFFKLQLMSNSDRFRINVTTRNIINNKRLSFYPVSRELNFIKVPGVKLFLQSQIVQSLSIIAKSQNRKKVSIVGGSGQFSIQCTGQNILCNYDQNDRIIQVIPFKIGTTDILIIDNLIYGRQTTKLPTQVIKPTTLSISGNSSMIQENHYFQVEYKVFDEAGKLINKNQYRFLDLKLSSQCLIYPIQKKDNIAIYQARRSGICTISAYINDTNRIDSSNSYQLQIFKKLVPSVRDLKQYTSKGIIYYTADIGVAIGCTSILTFTGGPERRLNMQLINQPAGIVIVKQLNHKVYELVGVRKGQAVLKYTLKDEGLIISQTSLKVTVKEINGVEILGSSKTNWQIYEGAQIRLLPQLLIDGKQIIDAVCPFVYQWKSTNQQILLVNTFPQNQKNIGANITGLKSGLAAVELKVIISNRQFNQARATFRIIPDSEVKIQTLISNPTRSPSSLLIPPNSGIILPKDYSIQPLSNCDKLLTIYGNSVFTHQQKGSTGIILRSNQLDKALTGVSVFVTKIHSLFIQNIYGVLNLQLDTEVKIKFYILDTYGRLFPNKLQNVDYIIKVLNPKIMSGYVSEDKDHVYLKGLTLGQTDIIIGIQGSDVYDIVPIRVANLIKPSSPVWIHEGGIVNFQIQAHKDGKWSSENINILKMDNDGKGIAIKQGTTNVVYNQGIIYKSKLNVFTITQIVKVDPDFQLSNLKSQQFKLSFRFLWLSKGILNELKFINILKGNVNNNLNIKCQTQNPEWFDARQQIRTLPNGEQVPNCYIKVRPNYPDSRIPSNLKLNLIVFSNKVDFKLIKHFSYPFHFEFKIPEKDIVINSDQPQKIIFIKTNQKLIVSSHHEKMHEWLTSQFNLDLGVQFIRLTFSPSQTYLRTTIKIENLSTKQKEEIRIVYNGSDSSSQQGSKLKLRWTDYIVLLMVFGILMILYNSHKNRSTKQD